MKKYNVCPECEAEFNYKPGLVGQTIRCQTCSHLFVVNGPPETADKPKAAAGPPPAPPPLPPKKARGDDRPRPSRVVPGRRARDDDDADDRPRGKAARYRDADDEAGGGRGGPPRKKSGGLMIGLMAFLGVLFVAVLGGGIVYLVWPNKSPTAPTATNPGYASNSNTTSSAPRAQPPRDDAPRNLDDILNQGKKNLPADPAPPPRKPNGRPKPNDGPPPDPFNPRNDPAPLPPGGDIAVKPLFPAPAGAGPSRVAFAGDTLEVASPHPISKVVPAGSGKYLILHHDTHQKVSILDVAAAKVVKTLPLGQAGAMIAGGHDFFVAYLPKTNEFQRFSLKTLEPDQKAANPHAGEIGAVGMGAASNGPVVACLTDKSARFPDRNPVRFFDPNAMKAAEYPVTGGLTTPVGVFGRPIVLTVSANGGVFAAWTDGFPFGVYSHVFTAGGRVERYHDNGGPRTIFPSADGQFLYTEGRIFGPDAKPLTEPLRGFDRKVHYLPAVTGPEYLMIEEKGGAFEPHTLSFEMRSATSKEAVAIPQVDGADGVLEAPLGQSPRPDKYFFLIPAAKVLAVHPPKNPNSIILCKIK